MKPNNPTTATTPRQPHAKHNISRLRDEDIFGDLKEKLNEPREDSNDAEGGSAPRRNKKTTMTSVFPALKLIHVIVDDSKFSPELLSDERLAPAFDFLGKLYGISPTQSVLLSVILERSLSHSADIDDIARGLSSSNLDVLTLMPELDSLSRKGLISKHTNRHGNLEFSVPQPSMDCLRLDKPMKEESLVCRTDTDFFLAVDNIFSDCASEDIPPEEATAKVAAIRDASPLVPLNQQLRKAQSSHKLSDNETIVLLFFCMIFLKDNPRDTQSAQNFAFLFSKDDFADLLNDLADFSRLQSYLEIVDNVGTPLLNTYRLSAFGAAELLSCNKRACPQNGRHRNFSDDDDTPAPAFRITQPSDILRKSLFFNSHEQKELDALTSALRPSNHRRIQRQLKASGLRDGIAIIFHGDPGTGKTEGVYQIARATGRELFEIDASNVRSRYVGDSEKNLQATFDAYNEAVRKAKAQPKGLIPILFLNEADALLTNRFKDIQHSSERTENTLQNILLQNIERFEGILICTTNLMCNLDKAFERRFLFKILFERPDQASRAKIWHAMFADLSASQCEQLACEFPLSGGNIENIARRRAIEQTLYRRQVSFERLRDFCQEESTSASSPRKIGF